MNKKIGMRQVSLFDDYKIICGVQYLKQHIILQGQKLDIYKGSSDDDISYIFFNSEKDRDFYLEKIRRKYGEDKKGNIKGHNKCDNYEGGKEFTHGIQIWKKELNNLL